MKVGARAVGALLILVLLTIAACRTGISLADPPVRLPDGGGPPPPSCPGLPGAHDLLATLDGALGPVHAIAILDGWVYVLANKLVRIQLTSTTRQEVVGGEGCAGAVMSADDAYVYWACPESGKVVRVARAGGNVAVIDGQDDVVGLAVDHLGGVYWSLPSLEGSTIRTADFSAGTPFDYAAAPPSVGALLSDGELLYASGEHEMRAFDLSNPSTYVVSPHCDGGVLAIEDTSLLCTEGAQIIRLGFAHFEASVLADTEGPVRELVVGGGRAFFRIERAPPPEVSDLPTVMSVPLDRIGGVTVIPEVPPTARALATDACFLYYANGSAIERWRF